MPQYPPAGWEVLTAWSAAGDLDPAAIASNTFTIKWPPPAPAGEGVESRYRGSSSVHEVDHTAQASDQAKDDMCRDPLRLKHDDRAAGLLAELEGGPDGNHRWA
jgi:hypothetical protein